MNDLVLYPIRGQLAQVNSKSEAIIYVPRADKLTHGIVKIGDGLLVDDGVVSLDLSKISTLQEQRIQEVRTELLDDIMNVDEALSDYKVEVEDSLSAIDDKILVIETAVRENKSTTDAELVVLRDMIKEKEFAVAYSNYREVVDIFNSAEPNAFTVGQPVFVQTLNVPDLWVYSVSDSHVNYGYTTDENIVNTLSSVGFIQIGYYKLSMMETKTTSVANVVTLDSVQTITAKKIFKIDKTYVSIDGDKVMLQHTNSDNRVSSVWVQDDLKLGNVDTTGGSFNGITIDPTSREIVVTGYGFKYNGKDVATADSALNTTSLLNILGDSNTIVAMASGNKVLLELDNTITNKLAKTLILPMSTPGKTELVAVDNTNSQKMIEIGDGLSLENGILKVTGGGGQSVDLTDYVKRTDYATEETAGVVKINSKYGINISPTSNALQITQATRDVIDNKTSTFRPLTPYLMDYALKVSLTTNTEVLNEEEQNIACNWLGVNNKIDNAIKTAIQDTWEASY